MTGKKHLFRKTKKMTGGGMEDALSRREQKVCQLRPIDEVLDLYEEKFRQKD
jgi:hypothetical protein